MYTQRLTWKRLTILSTTAVLVTLVAIGVVTQLTAHGGDGDVIHACVSDASGEIKIVGPDEECKPNSSPLDWNVQGIPGSQGMAGRNCWDRNGNGLPDLPDEDTNNDGVVDVLDCLLAAPTPT